MALINCPECGKQISDKAEKCPKCGKKLNENKKICSECGTELNEDEKVCHNCGYPVESKNDIPTTNSYSINTSLSISKLPMSRKMASKITKRICIICVCIGLVFLCMGFYKKNSYSNPDSDSSYSYNTQYTNSYVGGDAYNYIINGTYFTGYAVLGIGTFIIAAIMGTTSLVLSIEEQKDEEEHTEE